MDICIIGAGHVGLVTGACFADLGNRVICVDSDRRKIMLLRKGRAPFFEPALEPMVARHLKTKRLLFTADIAEGVRKSVVIFIAVGTPPLDSGDADLTGVENVARSIARSLTGYRLIVEKSTVPVDTGKWIHRILSESIPRKIPFDVASNPEFLREGSAVNDFLHPDRIVIGVESEKAQNLLKELYRRFQCPLVVTDIASAELIKHASNAFLATKISFINSIATLCEQVGADVEKVAQGVGLDRRIGPAFLDAGIGYGGFCLDGTQTVLVRERGRAPFRISLKELYIRIERIPEKLRVLSVDPRTYRTQFAPITAVSKRRFKGRLLTIRTKMNKEVRVTGDHPMLVFEGGSLVTRLAGRICPGDLLPSFLSYPSGLSEAHIDLIRELQSRSTAFKAHVRVRFPEGTVQQHREPIKVALKEAGLYRPTRLHDVVKNDRLSLEEYLAVESSLPRGTRGSLRLFTSKGHTTEIPARLAMDEDFCRFLGYYATEGHIHHEKGLRGIRSRIGFHFHEEETQYISDVTQTFSRLGIRYIVRSYPQYHTVSIICSSRLFAFLLESILGAGVNSYDADVPGVVFGLNPACREAFLGAAYRGDGSVSFPRHSPAVTYDFGTVSRSMAAGMSLLLHSVGIVPSAKIGRSKKSTTDCYYRRISGAKQVRRLPWVNDPRVRRTIEQRLSEYKRIIRPTGYQIVDGPEGQIGLTRVVSIQAEEMISDVYSIEVEGTETFVTDDGLIVHNCLPKDIEAFIRIAEKLGYDYKLLKAVKQINEDQRRSIVDKVEKQLWNLRGKKIGVLGLAFKPDTDDMRFAPSLEVIGALTRAGAKISAFDPQAMKAARKLLHGVTFAKDPYEAAKGSDCLLLLTEWNEFKELDLKRLKKLLRQPVIVDGRNLYDPAVVRKFGFSYVGIGRGKG